MSADMSGISPQFSTVPAAQTSGTGEVKGAERKPEEQQLQAAENGKEAVKSSSKWKKLGIALAAVGTFVLVAAATVGTFGVAGAIVLGVLAAVGVAAYLSHKVYDREMEKMKDQLDGQQPKVSSQVGQADISQSAESEEVEFEAEEKAPPPPRGLSAEDEKVAEQARQREFQLKRDQELKEQQPLDKSSTVPQETISAPETETTSASASVVEAEPAEVGIEEEVQEEIKYEKAEIKSSPNIAEAEPEEEGVEDDDDDDDVDLRGGDAAKQLEDILNQDKKAAAKKQQQDNLEQSMQRIHERLNPKAAEGTKPQE